MTYISLSQGARVDDMAPGGTKRHQADASGAAGLPGMAAYQRVAESIKNDIRSETLKPGDRLPSNRQMTDLHNVSLGTAQKALGLLETEGWVVTTPAVGVFVSKYPPVDTPHSDDQPGPLTAMVGGLHFLTERIGRLADLMDKTFNLLGDVSRRLDLLEQEKSQEDHTKDPDHILNQMADVRQDLEELESKLTLDLTRAKNTIDELDRHVTIPSHLFPYLFPHQEK